MIRRTTTLLVAASAGLASAQDIPLDYNWNGLAHASEVFNANADGLMGYRSISDRGIVTGTPDSLGEETGEVFGVYGNYQLIMSPDTLDCVFIGHRNASPTWDDVADGDTKGIAPSWDPTGGTGNLLTATTTFDSPIAMNTSSNFSIIYTASNGGGDFQVTLNFTDSTSVTIDCNAPDWFADFDPLVTPPFGGLEWSYNLPGNLSGGDGFAGTKAQDAAVNGEPLAIIEAGASQFTINSGLGFDIAGKSLESITFDANQFNLFNPNAAVEIFGLIVNGVNVPLDFNWNGISQPEEINAADTDSPTGYRSIGDRGLTVEDAESVGGGEGEVVTDNMTYHLAMAADAVDTIMVGTRSRVWDDVNDFDDYGVVPAWDVSGGTGVIPSWTSVLTTPMPMSSGSKLGLLYDASEGGGNFDMTLEFTDSTSVTVTLHAPDWFADGNGTANAPLAGVESQTVLAGPQSGGDGFASTQNTDLAVRGNPLNVTEAVVSADSLMTGLGFDVAGKSLAFITFDSGFGGSQAVGIYAAALSDGGNDCQVDVNNDGVIDFFDLQLFLNWYATGNLNADFANDGVLDFFDLQSFLNLYSAGC